MRKQGRNRGRKGEGEREKRGKGEEGRKGGVEGQKMCQNYTYYINLARKDGKERDEKNK